MGRQPMSIELGGFGTMSSNSMPFHRTLQQLSIRYRHDSICFTMSYLETVSVSKCCESGEPMLAHGTHFIADLSQFGHPADGTPTRHQSVFRQFLGSGNLLFLKKGSSVDRG
ncbi:unnamed protein product [Protopolystoma xenopodis]|uniref:Uncharacterized protein n=1 Tax=Protopolystoma xenopodis TaxID=117903 RepID=A0A448WP21_9PLAT|nr:unnamed protein product [Protopolystoma xenopodis]